MGRDWRLPGGLSDHRKCCFHLFSKRLIMVYLCGSSFTGHITTDAFFERMLEEPRTVISDGYIDLIGQYNNHTDARIHAGTYDHLSGLFYTDVCSVFHTVISDGYIDLVGRPVS
jgi:hypothetical protein